MKMREKRVCELENGSIKIIQPEEQRGNKLTIEKTVRDLWDNLKSFVIGILAGKKTETRAEYFKKQWQKASQIW